MKKLLVLVVLLWATVLHAQITYWWSQMLKKPDAKQSQEFFFVPGTNIYFTYATNRVIINGSGTNVVIATSTNSLYALYATNWIGSTNALTNLDYTYITNAPWQWACGNLSNWCLIPTNSLSSSGGTNFSYTAITNAPWQWGCGNLSNWCLVGTNVLTNIVAGGQTNIYSTNLIDYYTMLQAGTNILLTTNAGYLVVNFTPTNVVVPPDYISNLIAWWKMDAGSGTTAIDSSGHNNTGTLTNSPTWVTGHVGPFALQFNSNSLQGVYALTITNLSPYTNMTVTWWQYQTNSYNSGLQRVMWEQTYPLGLQQHFFCQVYIDDVWYVGWYTGAEAIEDQRLKFPANAANWPQNQWIHYAYVTSATGQKFYTNGVLCASTNLGVNPKMLSPSPFTFGMMAEVVPLFFDGVMDDFRIYSTNLTDTEIQGVYGFTGLMDLYVLRSGDTMSGGLTNTFGWLQIQGDPTATLKFSVPNIFSPPNYASSLIQMGTNLMLNFSSVSNLFKGPTYLGQGIYGDGSGLTNIPCCTNGAYSGSFTGDGSGLTNIPATNFVGQITLANLPNGVLTNNWNGPRVTITNSSLLVTGAQYIALSNGAANVLMTNGTITSSGNIVITSGKFGIGTNPPFAILDVKGTGSTAGRFQCPSGQYAGFQFWDSNPGNSWAVGHAFAQTSSADLVFSFGNNGTEVIKATISSTGSGGFNNNVIATNGVKLMVKPSFTTNFTCTTNLQTYLCNGTNQVVTLPNAAYVPNVIYRFAVTNGWAKVIITNATGAQTIRDGTSFSFTQVGIGSPSFFSDGAHWWSAARTKVVMPNAQFATSTNVPLTLANTAYPITFDSIANESQGIALGTNGAGAMSVMWITNAGQYLFLPSIVERFSGNNIIRYWFKSNGTNIPNSGTPAQGAPGATTIRVVTVPFKVDVVSPTGFEIWVQSNSTGDDLYSETASGNYPAAPSSIVPVHRISDPWP